MKINFNLSSLKLSAKMHLFIIISSAIIVLGLMIGIICEFAANGYYNYGADWNSYKSVTVTYTYVDVSGGNQEPEDRIKDICDKVFDENGIGHKYYICNAGTAGLGGEITYKFTYSTNSDKLDKAAKAIEEEIQALQNEDEIKISSAAAHCETTRLGSGKAFWRGAVALASVVAFQFIYFVIRYKLTMALSAMLANVHNLAMFLSLLAITRIPVGTSIFTFAVLTVVLTMIGCAFLFDKMRKNFKREDFKKLPAFEQVDTSAIECFKLNVIIPACLACVAVVFFVLMSISSLSPLAIISPVLCALISFISCAYGTTMFTPSVYSRFKAIGDDFKKKHARPSKAKASK